jgi:hypothetical protein
MPHRRATVEREIARVLEGPPKTLRKLGTQFSIAVPDEIILEVLDDLIARKLVSVRTQKGVTQYFYGSPPEAKPRRAKANKARVKASPVKRASTKTLSTSTKGNAARCG